MFITTHKCESITIKVNSHVEYWREAPWDVIRVGCKSYDSLPGYQFTFRTTTFRDIQSINCTFPHHISFNRKILPFPLEGFLRRFFAHSQCQISHEGLFSEVIYLNINLRFCDNIGTIFDGFSVNSIKIDRKFIKLGERVIILSRNAKDRIKLSNSEAYLMRKF